MHVATRTLIACCIRPILLVTLAGALATTSAAPIPSVPSAPNALRGGNLPARGTSGVVALWQGSAVLAPLDTWTLQFDYPAAERANVTHFRIFNDPPGTAANALLLEVAATVLGPHATDPAQLTANVAMPALKVEGVHVVTLVARNAPANMTAVERPGTDSLTITVRVPTAPSPGIPSNPRIRGTALVERQHILDLLSGRPFPITLDVEQITER